MRKITPKIINYPQDKRFQCLLNDIKVAYNYLQQYNGKVLENSDFLPPITTTKMDWVKQFLIAGLNHIREMEEDGVIFT